MKLYIPTCTLNFNNIFSTESISPACFYNLRGFGNRRFYKVEANNLDNVILLYSKHPYYRVDSGEIENSQLVLEIESEDYPTNKFIKVNNKDGVEVYVSNTTIYFNPFNFCAYFVSDSERQSTLIKAEQSLENKYSKLYSFTYKVSQEKGIVFSNLFSSKEYFEWKESYLSSVKDISPSNAKDDLLIDKIKGFVVCYIIGANMSVSEEVSRLKQLAKKMRNTLSAIVNSPQKKPTDIQDETLISYIKEFNSIYTQVDESSKYNKYLIDKFLVSPSTGLDKETILKVLQDLTLEDDFNSKLNLRTVYDASDLYNCLYSKVTAISDVYNNEIKRLFDAIKRVEEVELMRLPKNRYEDLFTINGKSIKILDSSKGTRFYMSLLNSQIFDEYKKVMEENGISELLSIAYLGGTILKSFIRDDEWEGSEFKSYINGLLMNIQHGEGFDMLSCDNIVLQSFAAFCQKGEEVERLVDYMLQCGFSDYRFALGIYGATRGFAALPKTFTNQLINGERSYYKDFYLHFYKEVFDIELASVNLPSEDFSSSIFTDKLSEQLIQNIDSSIFTKKKFDRVSSVVQQTGILEDDVRSPRAFMCILDNVLGSRCNAYKTLKKEGFENDTTKYSEIEFKEKIFSIIEQTLPKEKNQRNKTIEKINRAIELEARKQDKEAFMYILDDFIKPNDPAYIKLSELISSLSFGSTYSQYLQKEEKKVTQNSSSVFQKPFEKTSNLFVDDKNAKHFIWNMSYLPLKMRNVLCEKILVFQNDYDPNHGYYTKKGQPRTNNNTIDHFIARCTYKKGGASSSWIPVTLENENLLEQLKKELYKRYGNN